VTASGKSVLILGAGSRRGIGRACAARFAEAGYGVIVWDACIEGALPVTWESAELDITDWDRMKALSQGLPDLFAAINCISIGARSSITETAKADWDRIVSVNLNGAFYAARHIHPALARGRGTYVNLSSSLAESTFPNRAAFCVTKAALITLTRCMAIEWAAEGVRVMTITPGVTQSGAQVEQIASGEENVEPSVERAVDLRLIKREEVANAVFAACQLEFSAMSGANLNVDVGCDLPGGGLGVLGDGQ
jgi:NAD(P)-dependent dehydrogenase (short-subunit alcohol dehydrogenase family)